MTDSFTHGFFVPTELPKQKGIGNLSTVKQRLKRTFDAFYVCAICKEIPPTYATSLRFRDGIGQRFTVPAEKTGRSKAFHILETQKHLDDLEDIYIAEQRPADLRAGVPALSAW